MNVLLKFHEGRKTGRILECESFTFWSAKVLLSQFNHWSFTPGILMRQTQEHVSTSTIKKVNNGRQGEHLERRFIEN